MSKERPDHHDAEILLRAYDLRREPVMRASRDAILRKFWPASFEDIVAVTSNFEHELNAPLRQVGSYWEMIYGMAKWGVVHPDFLLESGGEGIFLYAKVLPHLERFRKEINPASFRNTEWITSNCDEGKRMLDLFVSRVEKMRDRFKAKG